MASQTQELIFPRDGNGHSFPQHIKGTHLGVDCFILNSLRFCRINKSEGPSVELNTGHVSCIHSELLSPNRVSLEKLNSISLEVDGHGSFPLVARWLTAPARVIDARQNIRRRPRNSPLLKTPKNPFSACLWALGRHDHNNLCRLHPEGKREDSPF